MKQVFLIRVILGLFLLPILGLGQQQGPLSTERLVMMAQDSIFKENNQLFEGTLRSSAGDTSQVRSIYDLWRKSIIKKGIDSGYVLNEEEEYFETPTPDKELNPMILGSVVTKKIAGPITTEEGDVKIFFGTTKSDNKNANQEVSPLLIKGISDGVRNANKALAKEGIPPIHSIYIMATTNGKHSKTSNHSKKLAVDVSRINGVKMFESKLSSFLYQVYENQIEKPALDEIENPDELFIFARTLELQKAFQELSYKRENFGPILKTKYAKETDKNNFRHPIGGHQDHIHFSVR